MQQTVILTATMVDGSIIRERTTDFGRFVTLALAFRADPACVRLVWVVIDPPPRPPAHAAALARLRLPQAAAAAHGLAQLAAIDAGDPDVAEQVRATRRPSGRASPSVSGRPGCRARRPPRPV